MKKVLKKIFIIIFIFIMAILIQNMSKAVNVTSNYYEINDEEKIIYAIEPETKIVTFKEKLTVNPSEIEIEIYKDKTTQEEIKDGFVGTGMILKIEDYEYELSVVGDFQGDGKATQIELSNEIRHIVGLKESKLEGIKRYSADLTLDGQVDQRDITKFIRYIVFGELDLGKKDTTPPIVDIELIKRAVSEITVRGNAIDKESGMGDNPIFTFYIKKENEPESAYVRKQSGKETLLNLTNLQPDTTYMIKIETQDKAGNKAEKTITVKTGRIPDGTEEGAIKFGSLTWVNGTASTTIETDKLIPIWEKETGDNITEKFQIEYQVNSITGEWKTGTNVTGLLHGDKVYARLWDGINAGTTSAVNNILDGTDPTASINLSNTDADATSPITATVTNSDNESGVKIQNCKWVYNTTATAIGTDESNYTGGTFSSTPQTITLSATTAGTYYLHVLTTDMAGRTKETISNAVTVITPKLANKVSVGDYVAYNATNNYSYTSPTGTGTSHGNGYEDQIFTSSSDIKWKVLSTNTSTGEVVLISETPLATNSESQFYMQGPIGYLYAEQELNSICSIYGHGIGADTSKIFNYEIGETLEGTSTRTLTGSGARSINVDDINALTGYRPTTGNTYTHTIYYPTNNTTTGLSSAAVSRTDTKTSYNYSPSTYLDSTGNLYKMLFTNETNSCSFLYWLASRSLDVFSYSTYFDIRTVFGFDVDVGTMGGGYRDSYDERNFASYVRPIVYLKTTVQTSGKNVNGEWIIIDE